VGALVLLISAYSFVPPKLSRKKRAIIGILHVSAHLAAALILMLLLEIGIEICIRHDLLATSGFFLVLVDDFYNCVCVCNFLCTAMVDKLSLWSHT
jgi:hypothetical protein